MAESDDVLDAQTTPPRHAIRFSDAPGQVDVSAKLIETRASDAELPAEHPEVAPPSIETSHKPVHAITDAVEYAAMLETLAGGEGPYALDTERASGFRFSQRAYLVQVFRRGAGAFLIDPTAFASLSDLGHVIGDTEVILHAALADLPSLREAGIHPKNLFDTELAGRLLRLERVGLASMIEAYFNVTLAKAHSAADWSKRPLPQEWLIYAALDVELLVDLRDRLAEELEAAGKTKIAQAEFRAHLDKQAPAPRADPWRRTSGVHAVRRPRQLAIVRALWLSRNERAIELDISPGRLIPDSAIVAAAKAPRPEDVRSMLAIPGFHGRAAKTDGSRWLTAIQEGWDAPPVAATPRDPNSLLPVRAWAEKNPEAARRLDFAREAVSAVADDQQVPAENLVSPEFIRRLAWDASEHSDADWVATRLADMGARQWQIDALRSPVADAFVHAHQEGEESDEALQ